MIEAQGQLLEQFGFKLSHMLTGGNGWTLQIKVTEPLNVLGMFFPFEWNNYDFWRNIYVGKKAGLCLSVYLFSRVCLNPTATESFFGFALSEFMKYFTTDGWLHKSLKVWVTHPRSPDAHIQFSYTFLYATIGHSRAKEIGHVLLIFMNETI